MRMWRRGGTYPLSLETHFAALSLMLRAARSAPGGQPKTMS